MPCLQDLGKLLPLVWMGVLGDSPISPMAALHLIRMIPRPAHHLAHLLESEDKGAPREAQVEGGFLLSGASPGCLRAVWLHGERSPELEGQGNITSALPTGQALQEEPEKTSFYLRQGSIDSLTVLQPQPALETVM